MSLADIQGIKRHMSQCDKEIVSMYLHTIQIFIETFSSDSSWVCTESGKIVKISEKQAGF